MSEETPKYEVTAICEAPKDGLRVKIKKLHPDAVIPTKAHASDAGFDLTAVSVEYDHANDCIVYHTGLAFEIPKGNVGLVYPRSSVYKKDLFMVNSTGVIDSGYRGEVLAKFKRIKAGPRCSAVYDIGNRIAQLIIMPIPEITFEEASELSDSDRGANGHGSTGI